MDSFYLICSDGDFVSYGKELEIHGKANHEYTLACLQFLIDKLEWRKTVTVRRMGLHDVDESVMKTDVSSQYLEYAKEMMEKDGE